MENENKENNIDNEFVDINKESKSKMYIIVGFLYLLIIILSILLILGLKHQKNAINDSMNNINEKPINNKLDSSTEDINNNQNINVEDNINSNKPNDDVDNNVGENERDNQIDIDLNIEPSQDTNDNSSILGDDSSILDYIS